MIMFDVNAMQLSLNGDTFSALKEDFDSILAKTIQNMKKKGTEDATVTVKVSIGLSEEELVDTNGDTETITKPNFKHEINSVMQVKNKKTGSMAGDYALVWDEEQGKFVMKKIVDNQTSMFDEDNVEYVDPDGENTEDVEDEARALPAGSEDYQYDDEDFDDPASLEEDFDEPTYEDEDYEVYPEESEEYDDEDFEEE